MQLSLTGQKLPFGVDLATSNRGTRHGYGRLPAAENAEFDVTVRQADLWEGLRLWRRENSCPSNAADHEATEGLWRKRWSCDHGSLELVLHRGGHKLPRGWTKIVLDWFESLNR